MHHPAHLVLVRLRWLQLRRSVGSLGRVLLALALCGVVLLIRCAVLLDPATARWIAGGALLIATGLHQRRMDIPFLQRHVPSARRAMAVEYGLLMLPVLLGLLSGRAWMAVVLLPLVLAVPWLPVVRAFGARGVWLRRALPAVLFELRSLVQTIYPWSVLLWLAALACCWLPVLPLFLLGLVALLAAGVQEQCEPRTMLLATSTSARGLLRTKLWSTMRVMVLIQLPVLVGATVFQSQWWWIHAFFGLGMLVLVAYAVVLKYANYRLNARLEANGAHVGVAAVFAILPGLSLVPLIMLLTEAPKARANLNTYFHAHDH